MNTKRDNFRVYIIKLFLLALFLFVCSVGLLKQLFYGSGVPAAMLTDSKASGGMVQGGFLK
jgi:hypothetical protein